MKIKNKTLLRHIFRIKGNFNRAVSPSKKCFDGIEIAPYKNGARAAVCISADFELNWAFRGRSPEERDLRGVRTRANLPYILNLLEDHGIPITWATVGHLFLKSCNRGTNGLPHPHMPRPLKNDRWEGDWYIHDPCTTYQKDPLWYAPDLLEKILGSRVKHEVGIHSFSHVDFSPNFSNRELIRCEITECLAAMEPFGLKPRSLVFPFNKMGYAYLDVLSDLNINAVRHRDAAIRISYPERTKYGVYKIYESMNLRIAKYYDSLNKSKIFIDEAVRRHGVYHLWMHPSDPFEVFQKELKSFVEYLCGECERLGLWITTMGELAAYCEAREKTTLTVKREGNELVVFPDCSVNQERYGSTELSLLIPTDGLPKGASVELEKDDRREHQDHKTEEFRFLKEKRAVVINIPADAKSLRLTF